MGDSWEDEDRIPPPPPPRVAAGLNPNAATFSFNPSASSFQPFTPPPPPPVAPPAASAVPEVVEASPATTSGEDRSSSIPEVAGTAERGASASSTKSPDPPTEAVKALKIDEPEPSAAAAPSGEPEVEEETAESIAKREAELKQLYEELSKGDTREHLNLVFIGHVDAGKSTIGGQILYLTGGVDERTIQKYEKEAKDKNRESWYMAYIMDTNEEERAKGKTVEVGRAQFETEKKRYTILDAPGHKNYVPNMIGGAAQADVGVLVIAARKGEFETGFERGGQTREHAQLAKVLGVSKLIVVVNKMDDPSITEADGTWSKTRFGEIEAKLIPFLKSCGYNPKRDLIFLPISGLLGHNIKEPAPAGKCPWYKGGTLFEILDGLSPMPMDPLAPFRMSIIDKYKEMGTIAMGKSEAGMVRKGDRLFVMPNRVPVQVVEIVRDEIVVNAALGGENLRLKLSGIDEDEIQTGFVICDRRNPVPAVTSFEAQLQLLDLLEHKSIFTAGYKCILHIHSLVEECEAVKLIYSIDLKTKEQKKVKFVKSGNIVVVRIAVEKPICVEKFEKVPQLGRFTLRDEGRTIAIGKIMRVPKPLKAGTGTGGGHGHSSHS